jgi:hypothetical protein
LGNEPHLVGMLGPLARRLQGQPAPAHGSRMEPD